ncbi:MAG: secretin N-terminal domain-containing protein [Pyrinomonadaceae bacterium]
MTTAQALDYLFLKERLFFQRIDRKTILVADQSQRMQYQTLGIRTFYLKNADPDKVRTQLATFIPPQPGRPPATVIANLSTNSLTIRDTPENLKVIEKIIESIDKDRAEVVMDVRIYEVTRTDLLQIGNQIGTTLGGSSGVSLLGGSRQVAQQVVGGLSGAAVPSALGAAFLLPSSLLTALQSKDRARLVFQTQLHAFDNEDSSADVGQKVPIQTATVPNYGFQGTPGQNPQNPGQGQSGNPNTGAFGNYGYPVVQYADVGLKLNFKPQVFPNRDVQVKMEITSSALTNAGDAGQNLTPSFSQRVIKGMARIPNNRTMMVANIAQDQEVRGQRACRW